MNTKDLENRVDNEKLSFILIKPDGMNNLVMLEDLASQVELFGLSIVDTCKFIFKKEYIKSLWPSHYVCPLTSALLNKYLTGYELKVLVLEGEDSITKTNKIKSYIRQKYSLGAFSNCIHTPSNLSELKSQLEFIFRITGKDIHFSKHNNSSTDFNPNSNPNTNPLLGIWGRFADLGEEILSDVVEKVWNLGKNNGWENLWSYTIPPDEAYVKLHVDYKNSIAYVCSCLYELFIYWEPERVLITVLEVDRTGSLIIASGKYNDMASKAIKLREMGLISELIPNIQNELVNQYL